MRHSKESSMPSVRLERQSGGHPGSNPRGYVHHGIPMDAFPRRTDHRIYEGTSEIHAW
jgi:hypothetical protein